LPRGYKQKGPHLNAVNPGLLYRPVLKLDISEYLCLITVSVRKVPAPIIAGSATRVTPPSRFPSSVMFPPVSRALTLNLSILDILFFQRIRTPFELLCVIFSAGCDFVGSKGADT
jgi:hypothetical protein